ncbi:MAG: CapA family protein [Actinomycetota bacterium]|nr:CapA family protein [Actinomycetota bacterium]
MSWNAPPRRPTPQMIILGAAVVLTLTFFIGFALTADFGVRPTRERPNRRNAVNARSSPNRPSPSPSPDPKGTLVVHATGDVSLDPNYVPNLTQDDFAYPWSGVADLFRSDDLTIVNLECPVSDRGEELDKEFTFRGDPDALPAMKDAGVEVANLGNNHAYDYGPTAFLDTIDHLEENDIAVVGGGEDDDAAKKAAVFDIKGWKVAVVGIGNVVEPAPEAVAAPGHPGVACDDDIDCMVDAVERADKAADIVFVTVHWGVELQPEPLPEQERIAEAVIDAGADAVFGHHSHRLGSLETYKNRPIFWSLGNFVWPAFSTAGATTGVARVVVTPDRKIKSRILPAFIEPSGHPVLREGQQEEEEGD